MGSSTKKDAPTNIADSTRGDQVRAAGADPDGSGARIAELEREVAALRGGRVDLDKSPRGGSANRS